MHGSHANKQNSSINKTSCNIECTRNKAVTESNDLGQPKTPNRSTMWMTFAPHINNNMRSDRKLEYPWGCEEKGRNNGIIIYILWIKIDTILHFEWWLKTLWIFINIFLLHHYHHQKYHHHSLSVRRLRLRHFQFDWNMVVQSMIQYALLFAVVFAVIFAC